VLRVILPVVENGLVLSGAEVAETTIADAVENEQEFGCLLLKTASQTFT
jgi:hypothetical protein